MRYSQQAKNQESQISETVEKQKMNNLKKISSPFDIF